MFLPPKLTKNQKNRQNCQIVWFFDVVLWYTGSWLSDNCQAIVWMVCRWEEVSDGRNSDGRNCMCWQNPENRNMDITTLTYWAAVWCIFCPSGASSVPKWGKHVTQHGQARCPSWADFVLSDRIINCCPSPIGWGHNDITEWQMGLGCFICDPYALGYNLTFPKGSNRLLCLWLQPPLVLPRRGDAVYSVSVIDWWCRLLRFCHRLVVQFIPFLP